MFEFHLVFEILKDVLYQNIKRKFLEQKSDGPGQFLILHTRNCPPSLRHVNRLRQFHLALYFSVKHEKNATTRFLTTTLSDHGMDVESGGVNHLEKRFVCFVNDCSFPTKSSTPLLTVR